MATAALPLLERLQPRLPELSDRLLVLAARAFPGSWSSSSTLSPRSFICLSLQVLSPPSALLSASAPDPLI